MNCGIVRKCDPRFFAAAQHDNVEFRLQGDHRLQGNRMLRCAQHDSALSKKEGSSQCNLST